MPLPFSYPLCCRGAATVAEVERLTIVCMLVAVLLQACALGPAAPPPAQTQVAEEADQAESSREIRRRRRAQERHRRHNRPLLVHLRERGLMATASEQGVVVTLPDLLFAFGSARLLAEADGQLEVVAEVLLGQARGRRVLVEGHTDSLGTELYNQGLSERRARAVAAVLGAAGVAGALLEVRGYGSRLPAVPNSLADGRDDPAGRARNRRVEVVILN